MEKYGERPEKDRRKGDSMENTLESLVIESDKRGGI